MIALLASLAFAQAPAETVVVWGEPAIRQARSAIVRQMEELGYKAIDKPGGRVLFKPPRRWLGRVWLEEGELRFLRPVVAWRTAEGVEWPTVDDAPFERTPAGTATSGGTAAAAGAASLWVLPSQRLLRPERERVERATADEREVYQETVRETAFRGRLMDLPDRLDALWADGTPLQPGTSLPDAAARKAAVLDHWATRADTREGDLVARAVAAWIRNTLQDTPDAVTPEEASAAEAASPGRTLGLD